MNKTIHFILTGGTIDGVNDERGLYPDQSDVKTYLKKYIQPYFTAHYTIPFLKDSLSVNDTDRRIVCDIVQKSSDTRFVLSHGTDTMIDTAKFLKKEITGKTIILTGAFDFLSNALSDGGFNLGFACHAVMHTPPGVYIAMNGTLFDPDNVRKNHDTKRFETL